MGYRWECHDCDFLTWNEDIRKQHQTDHITHRVWGGSKYWKYPDGLHIQYLRKVIPKEKELWKKYCDEIRLLVKHNNHYHLHLTTEDGWTIYKMGKYVRPELGEIKSNRKHKPKSRKQGCPKCNKSENIRFVSKGKLICKACNYTFGKGEKV